MVGASRRNWKLASIELGGLAAFAWLLHLCFNFPFGSDLAAKGPNDLKLAFALGVCMVLGMLARFFYVHFEQPKRKRPKKFDWGLLIAPLCASGVIFFPLLFAFQSTDIDLANLTAPKTYDLLCRIRERLFLESSLRQPAEGG